MKSFLFNMGFDPSHVLSVLTAEGVTKHTQIVLIAPTTSEKRQSNAIDEIESFTGSLDVDVRINIVDDIGESFPDRIESIKQLLSDLDNIVLSLSGGTRDCLIPLSIAATLEDNEIEKVYFRSDIDSELETVELPSLPLNLSTSHVEVIKSLEGENLTAREIKEEIDKSESAVYGYLEKLGDENLVKSEGSPKKYSLTFSGSVFV